MAYGAGVSDCALESQKRRDLSRVLPQRGALSSRTRTEVRRPKPTARWLRPEGHPQDAGGGKKKKALAVRAVQQRGGRCPFCVEASVAPARRVHAGCPSRTMPLTDHAPAALRGVATAASWFVIIVSLWVADKNRRPNAFAVLVWLAALSALAASMVGCFSFSRAKSSSGVATLWQYRPLFRVSGSSSPSSHQRSNATWGRTASRWRPSPSSPRSWPPRSPSPRRGSTSTGRSSPTGAVPRGRRCRRARRALPPWCVCPDVRAWWGSRQSVVTTPPEKAADDAPRLLYPIPGAAEARVVPVDPAADERAPPPPLTVYPRRSAAAYFLS